MPCIAKKVRGVPANSSGMLVATNQDPAKILFFARKGWGARAQTISLDGCVAVREPKFLSENLEISPEAGKGASYLFIFERGGGPRVQQIVEFVNNRLSAPANTLEVVAPA